LEAATRGAEPPLATFGHPSGMKGPYQGCGATPGDLWAALWDERPLPGVRGHPWCAATVHTFFLCLPRRGRWGSLTPLG